MDQTDNDPRELERRLEQASRIASSVTDKITLERIVAWIEELKLKLRRHRETRRINHEVKARARELWEQSGQPAGRDLEFWLKAESEILARHQD
jgi:hypothetical protein